MRGAIPLLPHTPSWRGAQLKHGDNFTFNFTMKSENIEMQAQCMHKTELLRTILSVFVPLIRQFN